jgi:hypothetical protein
VLAASGVFAAGLTVMAAAGTHVTRDLIARKNEGVALARRTEAPVPPDAQVITFNLTPTLRRYGHLETLELYEQDRRRLELLVASPHPLFLLVDVPSLRGQWRDLSPGRNFRLLQRGPGLTALWSSRGFTLFRVGPEAAVRESPPDQVVGK